jgi:hypothetical protein
LNGWDGAAGSVRPDPSSEPAKETPPWVYAYYREVVLEDEKRFLLSEARLHMKVVGPGLVSGERKVVIQDGKCVIEVADDVWRLWREYEARGKEEEERAKKNENEEGEGPVAREST